MSTQAKGVEGVENIKNAIGSSDLLPIEHSILRDSFLADACDPEAAASEVRQRILASPSEPIERVLRRLKADWHTVLCTALQQTTVSEPLAALLKRRDQGRCCVSPRDCAQLQDPVPDYILSPTLEPLLRPENQEPVARLLRAFVAPKNVSYLHGVLSKNAANTSNGWLLSPGLGLGLRQHKLRVRVMADSPKYDQEPIDMEVIKAIKFGGFAFAPNLQYCDGKTLPMNRMSFMRLNTDCPSELPLPSPYLVQLQRTFANALHRFSIEENCLQPWPERQTTKFWSRPWLLFFRRLWHFVPRCFRTWTYRRMLRSCKDLRVEQMYTSPSAGLIAKRDRGNEAAALALLEAEAPDVPAPLLIDTFQDHDGSSILIMTQVPGVSARTVFYRMTYQERRQLADDLGAALAQIRRIPNRSSHLFTGVSKDRSHGSKIYDMHVGYEACGPFETELEWNISMTGGKVELWSSYHPKAVLSENKSVFTHADLHLHNIFVDGGKLSGIIDWEISGFYPEYWEFSKAMNAGLNPDLSHPIHRQIWQGKYEAEGELVAELMSTYNWGPPRIGEN